MGYTYEIQYKKGIEDVAADALSRLPSTEVLLLAISVVQSDMLALIQVSYALDPLLQGMVQGTTRLGSKYQLVDGYLRRNGKLVITSLPFLLRYPSTN